MVGCIPFPRVLALCEMKTTLSRISIQFAMSISYDNDYYTMSTSIKVNGIVK